MKYEFINNSGINVNYVNLCKVLCCNIKVLF